MLRCEMSVGATHVYSQQDISAAVGAHRACRGYVGRVLELLAGDALIASSRTGFEVGFVGPDGAQVRTSLVDAAPVRFELAAPVRAFRSYKRQRSLPGELVVFDHQRGSCTASCPEAVAPSQDPGPPVVASCEQTRIYPTVADQLRI